MSTQLFDTVYKNDYLGFLMDGDLDYRKVSKFMELDSGDVSKIAAVRKASVRFDSNIPKSVAQRLEEIANIANRVAGIFDGDQRKTALWFRTTNPLLGNISPRDMIRLGRFGRLSKFIDEAEQSS